MPNIIDMQCANCGEEMRWVERIDDTDLWICVICGWEEAIGCNPDEPPPNYNIGLS